MAIFQIPSQACTEIKGSCRSGDPHLCLLPIPYRTITRCFLPSSFSMSFIRRLLLWFLQAIVHNGELDFQQQKPLSIFSFSRPSSKFGEKQPTHTMLQMSTFQPSGLLLRSLQRAQLSGPTPKYTPINPVGLLPQRYVSSCNLRVLF